MAMRFTKKIMFAIDAVLDIAYHISEDPVQSKDIADRHHIPKRYLEQVLQGLVRTGVLKGTRGPRGGYNLAKERRRITLADIVRVVNKIEDSTQLWDAENGSELSLTILRPLWQEMYENNMKRLGEITLQDLCDRAKFSGVQGVKNTAPDNFMI